MITVHYEAKGFEKALDYLQKKGVKVGIAIRPETDVSVLKKYENKMDNILIMTVHPGLGGQEYIEKMNDKILKAKKMFKNKTIEIDGGVNEEKIRKGFEIGVDIFVIGTAIISKEDYYSEILKYSIIHDIETLERRENNQFEYNILMIKQGGYGQGDILLGVGVPSVRRIARKYYKCVDEKIIRFFLKSKYHDYRRLGIFLVSNIIKQNSKNIEIIEKMNKIIFDEIKYINNWDLTDEVGPNILSNYLLMLNKKERDILLDGFLDSKEIWKKRIGIVSLLKFAREDKEKRSYALKKLSKNLYEEYHLFQKASGWVLREVYKTSKDDALNYLIENNKKRKLPSVLLSYATEKMSKEEKELLKV